MSKIERRILDFLVEYLKKNTYQPSIREIGKRFGIKSTKTVSEYLQALADKGYIEREASRSRGVKIVGLNLEQPEVISVPFYGKIAAGEPMLIPENRDRFITLDRAFVPSEDCFFLRVAGDSMIGRGIFDRDFVLELLDAGVGSRHARHCGIGQRELGRRAGADRLLEDRAAGAV